MLFEVSTLENGVVQVKLGGRLDLDAALKLENPFTFQIATQKAAVVVDLSTVDFIASIGLRLLVKNAQAVQGRGGKLVLLNPTTLVRESLTTSGIATIIPLFDDFNTACQNALAGMRGLNAPSTVPERLALRIDLAELGRLAAWVGQLASAVAASARDRFRLDLVLTEVVTNILTHAGPTLHGVELEAALADTWLQISVVDSGPPFDPLAAPLAMPPTRLEDATPGGLGLGLIRGYCDDAHYLRDGASNRLTLIFRLGAAAPAAETALCRAHPLLQEIPPAELAALVSRCRTTPLAPGEVLLTPGSENHTLFFLLQGRLQVHLNTGQASHAFVIQAGEIIGEMSIIEHRPVFARVVADQPSTVLAMPEAVFWNDYCSLARVIPGLLKSLVVRMRRTNAVLQAELEHRVRYEMLQRELASAGKIQTNILPGGTSLFESPAVDVCPYIRPAREVGGDFYDAITINRHRLAVAVGDVSGKGMPAALFMVRAVTMLRMLLLRHRDPARVLPELNRLLCAANDECMFVTLAVIVIDTETGRATYLNAGHNPVLFAPAGGAFATWAPPAGVLLGVSAEATFALEEKTLAAGDSVVLYTDGITEAENGRREMFGLDRTVAALSRPGRPCPVAAVVAELEQSVVRFVDGAPQSDDITLLALTFHGEPAGRRHSRSSFRPAT